ncbi:SNF2-related protein [Geobacter grbiciae]|uniref:SNF2-related protein n=1 Tax=Geobacter grbiciae TaxID=155042 RepID=UPI001C015FF1|nr:DEAD/DEAH box helicase [Geobacter grbiciae]MBT1075120.1 DEAD/DEAH box helicase [Geobacter grbiciae]
MSKRAREDAENKRKIIELAEALAKRKAGQEKKEREKPAAKGAPLPEALEREVLQLLSVIFAPASRTAISSCLNRAGIRNTDGRQFVPAHVEPLLQPLVQKGFVILDALGYRLRLELCHRHTREAVAAGRFEAMAAAVQQEIAPQSAWGGQVYYRSYLQAVRDVRISLHRGRAGDIQKALDACAGQFPDEVERQHPYRIICQPFDAQWLDELPLNLYLGIVAEHFNLSQSYLIPTGDFFAHFEARYRRENGADIPFLRQVYATELILRGRVREGREVVASHATPTDLTILAWADFLAGDDEGAIARYEQALTLIKKELNKRKYFFTDIPGMFFIPSLIRTGQPDRLRQAEEYASFVVGKRSWNFWSVYYLVSQVLAARRGVSSAATTIDDWSFHLVQHGSVFQTLFALLAQLWTGGKRGKEQAREALPLIDRMDRAGYRWLAHETALACRALGAGNDAAQAEENLGSEGVEPLHALISRRASWESALAALARLGSADEAPIAKGISGESRLVWVLRRFADEFVEIQPKEQKRTPSGGWTAGRAVALKRLKEGAATLSFLTEQDRKVCAGIIREKSYYYRGSQDSYSINPTAALPLLVGHPLAFADDGDLLPLEIVTGEPQLRVKRQGDRLRLTIVPLPGEKERASLVWETRTRLKVIEINDRFRKVAEIVGEGLTVPAAAEGKVLEAVGAVSSLVTVHSDIGGGDNLEERPADPTPLLLLTPYGEGLRLELRVRPLGEDGPLFGPGAGAATIMADLGGARVQARRDLAGEAAAAERVTALLPLQGAEEEADGVWLFHEPGPCLELLQALHSLEEVAARTVWPEGEKLRVSRPHDASKLRLGVRESGEWFQLEGSLETDDGEVLELRKLLDLLDSRVGRFIILGEGRFLTLTDQFRRRLEELRSFTEFHGKGVRCALPALASLEELATEAGSFTADKKWEARLERLREAENLMPAVPSTLQADLREYQQEGFQWLARLAHWGAGACLADDMGLGKTVQALALILSRAPGGPTLVAAPTSVCMNWETEAARFAPTLNVIVFGPGDRRKVLAELQPFDLVICSYGLLQQEAELMGAVSWQTIVLDEAQAIKNMATKRSQAAMSLQGGFRLITTGTPVENHLGELWNLFRFINPGLLGSHRSFTERFAAPIEKNNDKGARERLKKLVRPFILRRTKAQVLTELPLKTEIAVSVEPGAEERAFQEAVRLNALERIEGSAGPEGERRLRILAEIMRLRRACCHPRLVLPESPLAGAKLAACMELVEELRDNSHKALVFSQFVDHLAIVREELDRREISYQYLDGSTTLQERKKRVDAFQGGEGELFLISLKAGGTGLNLTAADYVIHLDPWWNPAVEDQASDRAHRIGQNRPVTVYRLVTKNSIEEKIIALHQTKRDLADSLLEGTETGARISADELLALLREV